MNPLGSWKGWPWYTQTPMCGIEREYHEDVVQFLYNDCPVMYLHPVFPVPMKCNPMQNTYASLNVICDCGGHTKSYMVLQVSDAFDVGVMANEGC